jgi:hypothetical protein
LDGDAVVVPKEWKALDQVIPLNDWLEVFHFTKSLGKDPMNVGRIFWWVRKSVAIVVWFQEVNVMIGRY